MRASELHRLARAIREIALVATGNVDDERVSPGELAIVEDVAEHPGASIGEVAERTRLAQSLVSRVTGQLKDAGVFAVEADERDRRRTILNLRPDVRRMLGRRARTGIEAAVAASLPHLSPEDQQALIAHLSESSRLIESGREGGAAEKPNPARK